MQIVNHQAVAVHELAGIEHRTIAGLAHGLETLDVWKQRLRPGAATPPHHHHCEEVVVVLAGAGVVELDGQERAFAAGESIVIPPGIPHRIVNTGTADVELLGVFGEAPARAYGPDGNLLALPWDPPAFVPPGQMRRTGSWRMYR
jgi:mannose-6-phosphate isomerase-like protein (cupin superfamily)